LKYIQFSQELSLFLIPSIILAQILKKGNERYLKLGWSPAPLNVILIILLVILSIPLISYTGILNSRLELPQQFSAIQGWMKSEEEKASRLTAILVTSSGVVTLCINVFFMAIVPAFCEELLFRGTFQPLLSETLRSSHAGIWITAIIFSSIHLQFFGFIPRLILGLVFGYLFYWTGNLWYSIIAHFINNFVSVIVVYFYGWKTLSDQMVRDSRGNPAFPLTTVILSAVILVYFWNEFRKRSAVSQSHP
jgi:membrane protease YdiL (CAAX protease family)